MGRLTPQEFTKKYNELPPNLREAYVSVNTDKILEEIGKKHGLRIDQIGELMNETGYVMLGATPPSDYVMKIEGTVGVSREKAKAIAVDVNEQVFKAIRDALKRVHKIGGYRDIPPKNMAAPPQKAEYAAPPTEPLEPKEYAPAAPVEEMPKNAAPLPAAELPHEEPPAPSAPIIQRNLSEERLTKTFSLPHDEKTYTVSEDGKELKEEEDGKYTLDPYREPVE